MLNVSDETKNLINDARHETREVPGVVDHENDQWCIISETPMVHGARTWVSTMRAARRVPWVVEQNQWANMVQQAIACGRPWMQECENHQQCARHEIVLPGVVLEHEPAQWAVAREVLGVLGHESAQWNAGREVVLGLLEHKSAQWEVAREEPAVRECESRQCAASRLNKIFQMAWNYIDGQFLFNQICGLWNAWPLSEDTTQLFHLYKTAQNHCLSPCILQQISL